MHEVQSATFVLEKSSTITDVAMRTSGNFRDNTRHTVSRLIGIVGDGHERLLQDWTDENKTAKFQLVPVSRFIQQSKHVERKSSGAKSRGYT